MPVTISNLRMQLKWAWDEYARPKPVKDDGDLPPLPIDDSELEEEAHSKTLEKIIFSAVFVIIGILFYLRGRVLNQLPLARQDRPVREAENAVAAEPQEAAHADQNARENNGILPNQQPPAPAGQEANV